MAPDIQSTRDGGIATVTLVNPDKLNALNAAMWRRLAEKRKKGDATLYSLYSLVSQHDGKFMLAQSFVLNVGRRVSR